MHGLPLEVQILADSATGTISRRDLVSLGYPRWTIDRWVARGLLEVTLRGERRIPGSSQPLQQQLATMLWRAGRGARLAGALSLALRDLDGFPLSMAEESIGHIAIPAGRHVRGVDFRVVRTPLPPEDHDRILDLPAVTVTRGLIGAAATYHRARIRKAFYSAKHLGYTSDELMAARLKALGNAYGAAKMRQIVATGELAHESERELALSQIFLPGDPAPAVQVWVHHRGRWHRLDFAFLEVRLAMEYDGEDHERTREQDADRDLALKELKIDTIRVTKSMMRDPVDLRRRILKVYADRSLLGLPPLVPQVPPWV
jgi:hypothetical protein